MLIMLFMLIMLIMLLMLFFDFSFSFTVNLNGRFGVWNDVSVAVDGDHILQQMRLSIHRFKCFDLEEVTRLTLWCDPALEVLVQALIAQVVDQDSSPVIRYVLNREGKISYFI